MRCNLITRYREGVIQEIQEKLYRYYKFSESSNEQFAVSKLFKYLKRMEYQILESLQTEVLEKNADRWMQFIQHYSIPHLPTLAYEIANPNVSSREFWVCPKVPLLKLRIECSQTDGSLQFEPTFQQICSELQLPLQILSDLSKSFQRLEQTVLPLIEFSSSSNYYVFESLGFLTKMNSSIEILVQEQWDNYVSPIVDKHKAFSHFFLPVQHHLAAIFSEKCSIHSGNNLNKEIHKNNNNLTININGNAQVTHRTSTKYAPRASQNPANAPSSIYSKDKVDILPAGNLSINIQQFYADCNSFLSRFSKPTANSNQNNSTNNGNQHSQSKQVNNSSNNNKNNTHNNNNDKSRMDHNSTNKTDNTMHNNNSSNIISNTNQQHKSQASSKCQFYGLKCLKSTALLREVLSQFDQEIFESQTMTCNTVITPMFEIDCFPCKTSTASAGNAAKAFLLKAIFFVVNLNIDQLEQLFDQLITSFSSHPTTEEDLVNIKETIQLAYEKIAGHRDKISEIGEYLSLLEECLFEVDQETQEKYWTLFTYPSKVLTALKDSKSAADNQEKKLKDMLEKEKINLQHQIEKIAQDLLTVKNFNNYQLAKDYCIQAQALNEHINDASYQTQQINKREKLLQLTNTKYVQLETIKDQSIYFIKLWELAFQLQIDRHRWVFGPLMRISYGNFSESIAKYDEQKELIKTNILIEDKTILKVIAEIQKDIDLSREISWMIEYLTAEGMIKQPQFYKELFKACNVPEIEPNDEMSVKLLIDADIVQFRDQIREVSERAEHVLAADKQLSSILDRMKEITLDIQIHSEFYQHSTYYQHSDVHIVTNFEVLESSIGSFRLIIEDIKYTQKIQQAVKKSTDIENKLNSVTENIQYIKQFQSKYLHAREIYVRSDLGKMNSTLVNLIQQSESFWKAVIRQIKENSSLYETDYNFDYLLQINNIQKFIDSFQ